MTTRSSETIERKPWYRTVIPGAALLISVSRCRAHHLDLPCLATSSLIPPPPTSKTTLPTGTRHAQNSKLPFPLPILVSFPLTHTGTSGNTRKKHSAPLTGLILRLIATWAEVSCAAVSRAGASKRRPN